MKTMFKEQEGFLHVLVDTSRSMRFPYEDKLSLTRELAAAFCFLAQTTGSRVAIYPFAEKILAVKEHPSGEGQIHNVLRTLTRIPEGKSTALGRSLRNLMRIRTEERSKVLIISDFFDSRFFASEINYLLSKGTPVGALQILNHREIDPPSKGYVTFMDPESSRSTTRLVGFRTRKVMKRMIDDFLLGIDSFFSQRGALFHRSFSGHNFEDVVMDYLFAGRNR
jgi:uncharacterized protein (DUF58 family)